MGSTNSAQASLLAGAIAFSRLDFELAFDSYSKALEQNPNLKDRTEALSFRALSSDLARKYDRAKIDYDSLVELVGDSNPVAYRMRGQFYYKRGDFERSLADYTAGAKRFPTNSFFPSAKGMALTSQGKYSEAIDQFDEAIRLDPTSPEFLIGRGEALVRLGAPDKAIEDYNKAIAIGNLGRDDVVRLRVGRGYAHLRLKNCKLAIEDFDAALDIKPKTINALKWRGLCFERNGAVDHAVRDYGAALQLDPSDKAIEKRLQIIRDRK